MFKNEAYNMDPDKYLQCLEDMVWDDPKTALSMESGHTNIHFQKDSVKDMITRIIREGVDGAGGFASPEDAMELIQNAVIYRSQEIADWMMSKRMEFDDPRDYHTKAFTVYMGENEVTGRNYDDKFREMESHAVKIVLKRDYSDYAPLGFCLITAYPEINEEHTKYTGKQLSPRDIAQNKLYDFRSGTEKAAFLTKDNSYGVKVRYAEDRDHNEYASFSVRNGDVRYTAYLAENELKIVRQSLSEKKRLDPTELEQEYPKLSSVLKDALYYQRGGMSFEEKMEKARAESEKTKQNRQPDKIRERSGHSL